MECRICFEEDDVTKFLSPCQCRGTSSFIHPSCLDRYIQYYPDRICRVCNTPFLQYNSRRDIGLCVVVFLVLGILLFFSHVRILMKLFLLGMTVLLSLYFLHRGLFSTTPIVFLTILCMLFLPGGHPSATDLWVIALGIIVLGYTLGRQVPALMLLGILTICMVFGYVFFLTMFAYHALDTPAFTVYVSILYLSWYAWLHTRPTEDLRLRAG
jgi:hypothetical protein